MDVIPQTITTTTVTLVLSEEEATVLCAIIGSVGGLAPEGRVVDELYDALSDVVGRNYDYLTGAHTMFRSGSVLKGTITIDGKDK